MTEIKIPKVFVGLHSHSLSLGDSIGLPPEHMDFVLKNGGDALAITDHGNMSAMSHQYLHQKKLDGKGVKFLSIYGNEMYAIDSLDDWRAKKAQYEQDQATAKALKADAKKRKDSISALKTLKGGVKLTKAELEELDLSAPDPIGLELKDITSDLKLEKDDDADEGGTIVEDSDESKNVEFAKKQNPLRKRGHLVMLAKNADGLKALNELTSRSFKEGFYYFPRTDMKMVKQIAKGNIIGLTACVSGIGARVIYENLEAEDWQAWHGYGGQSKETFERVQSALKLNLEGWVDAFGGKENFYPELQFNALGCIDGEALLNTQSGLRKFQEVVESYEKEEIKVLSYNESTKKSSYKKVIWGKLTKKKTKVLKITLENGKSLKLTPEHKIFTNKGWIEAQNLKNFQDIKILCE